MDKENAGIGIGDILQLNATILPDNASNKNIIWKSSDESIATVDSNGLVTGIKKGSAEITAITNNNLTDKVSIKVFNKANYGTSASSLYSNLYLRNATETIKITQTNSNDNYPKNGNFNYTYSLNDAIYTKSSFPEFLNQEPYDSIYNFYSEINSEMNDLILKRNSSKNVWLSIHLYAEIYQVDPISISDFKLIFSDDKVLTLRESIEQSYIEPLVIIASTNGWSGGTPWNNFFNIMMDGKTTDTNGQVASIIFKVRDKAFLKGIHLYSNVAFNHKSNGCSVIEYKDVDLSITPFE